MKLFGFHIISDAEMKERKRHAAVFSQVVQCHRWFAGWKDLDIIWDYILSETYFGDISSAREKYADARKTDVYGEIK